MYDRHLEANQFYESMNIRITAKTNYDVLVILGDQQNYTIISCWCYLSLLTQR